MAADLGTLSSAIQEWTDADLAQYSLAVALGMIDPDRSPFATKAKHLFWTDNNVGGALYEFLETLARIGLIDRRDEPDLQFRWNASYAGSWEWRAE
jgi:hypothetical protein